jgi:hypothetical protein
MEGILSFLFKWLTAQTPDEGSVSEISSDLTPDVAISPKGLHSILLP